MSPKKLFLALVFPLLVCVWKVNAQTSNDQNLRDLDSMAFTALEKNAPNVMELADRLLKESPAKKPSIYRVNAYTIYGIVNKNRGFYVTALDYYLKALNEAEKLKDTGRRSACLNNIGSVYQLQGKYERAIEYFNQSLELEKKLKLPLQKSIRLYNLGECYKDIDSLDLALTYLNSSLIIEKKERNNEGIVYAELGIADVYIRIESYTDASIVLQKTANRIGKEQIEEQIILHKLLGKLYRRTGKLKPALAEYIAAEKISIKYKMRTHLPELIKLQIEIHELNKDWQKASLKYAEYVKLNEEMNSLQIKNQLDDLNYRNELSKKQLEIELVQEERDLARKNEQLEKDLRIFGQKITWFVILLMMSSVILIVTGIKKLTNKNK